jgi:hypothetical protein
MRTRRPLLWAFLPAILLTQAVLALAQTVCNVPEAKLGNNFIQIEPNGKDDTETIQCALDLAVENNIPEIRLSRGEFRVSTLSVQDFRGTLQGGGKDYTRLTVSGPRDCRGVSGAIKFAGGEPRMRWLTVGMPREGFPYCPTAVVHFTGVTNRSGPCSYDVIYATIDRVALEGAEPYQNLDPPWDFHNGILVSPEDSDDPSCHNELVGTFKLNRSDIDGFDVGVSIQTLRGGAQIGVYKSTFDGNHTGLHIEDADATITVSENHFASIDAGTNSGSCWANAISMHVANSEDVSPGITRLDIHGNTFDVRGRWPCNWLGLIIQGRAQAILRPVISNNYFRLTGDYGGGLVGSSGVSGGVLNSNRINVTGRPGMGARLTIHDGTDWTIVLNEGFEHTAEEIDIALGTNTMNILIGPGQGATVKDEGTNNIILPQ